MYNLIDKTVLVTGAAKGIGRECSRHLALLGATLYITDIDGDGLNDTAACIAQDGGHATALKCDVTNPGDWQQVIDAISEQSGALHVLVNNAGIILNKRFATTSFKDFQQVMDTNINSVFHGCKAALPLMQKTAAQGSIGSIINFSSIYGLVAGPMHAAYCASKGAVRLFTKALAVELGRGPAKIRANSIHPGPTRTGLGLSGVEDAVKLGVFPSTDQGEARVAGQFPMERWGEATDICGAVAFLASDASSFVTGTEVVIDGGFTAV